MGRTMRRSRGFLLILCLLIVLLLFVLGLSFLGKRATQYQRVSSAQQAAQARAMACAGLEDVLSKLDRDLQFPQLSEDQSVVSYTEEILDNGSRAGAYTVTVDGRYRGKPYHLLLVTVVGESGVDSASAATRRTFRAEFDVSPLERYDYNLDGDFEDPNPYYRKVINFNDLGGL